MKKVKTMEDEKKYVVNNYNLAYLGFIMAVFSLIGAIVAIINFPESKLYYSFLFYFLFAVFVCGYVPFALYRCPYCQKKIFMYRSLYNANVPKYSDVYCRHCGKKLEFKDSDEDDVAKINNKLSKILNKKIN